MQGAGHAQLCGVFADALLEPRGGIRALSQGPGGFPYTVPGELRRLEQQLPGIVGDFAVQSAHDARQGHRAVPVADHEVFRVQPEFLFIQGLDDFALLRPPHDDLRVLQHIQVKGVHRLPDLQQHVVRDVHHVADGPQPAQRQVPLHPPGALPGGDVPYAVGQVPGAQIRRLHGHLQAFIFVFAGMVVRPGHFQFLAQDGRHFPGDAEHALAVRPVRGHGDVEQVFVQPGYRLDVLPGHRVLRQVQQAVFLRTGIQVLVQPQLFSAAQHAFGGNPVQGLRLDGDPAGQGRPVQGRGRVHAGVDVRRAGYDLLRALVAAVDLAGEQVRAFHRFAAGDLAHDDAADLRSQLFQFFHFKSAPEKLFLQLLGADVDIHVFLQPAERCNHCFRSSIPLSL